MPLGVVTAIFRDGDPFDPGDPTPYVVADILGTGSAECRFYGDPPPLRTWCWFSDVGGGEWFCEGPREYDIRTVFTEEFLTMPDPIWQSWTPQIDQGASSNISKTVNYAKYMQIGKLIVAPFKVSMTAAGTGGSAILVSLPVTAASAVGSVTIPVGTGFYFDLNVTTAYNGSFIASSTTRAQLNRDQTSGSPVGTVPNIAVASGDIYEGVLYYEAA